MKGGDNMLDLLIRLLISLVVLLLSDKLLEKIPVKGKEVI